MPYGIIEYNDDGQLKCELCGKFFNRLSNHLRYTHRMTSSDYKATFGLNKGQSLWCKVDSLKQREIALSMYDKCIKQNLIENPGRKPFKKGHIGRPKYMLREQALIALRIQITSVDKERIRELCRELGKSGLGLAKRRELRDLKLNHNGRTIKFDEELSKALPVLIGWSKKRYGAQYDEDITSDVVLKALEWGKFDFRRGKMITWLVGMTINLYKQKFKKIQTNHRRLVSLEDINDVENAGYELEFDIYDAGEDRVLDCMEKLTPREKQIIELLIEGKKVRHMAEICGIKPQSMKSFLHKTRTKLKNELSKLNVSLLDN